MDRTARSWDTELKSYRSSSLLNPLHPRVLRYCNPLQFLAIAIREASVMLAHVAFNIFNPVKFSEMAMMLASDI
jgi:hypothetical protein